MCPAPTTSLLFEFGRISASAELRSKTAFIMLPREAQLFGGVPWDVLQTKAIDFNVNLLPFRDEGAVFNIDGYTEPLLGSFTTPYELMIKLIDIMPKQRLKSGKLN